jgi:hypothetical protein
VRYLIGNDEAGAPIYRVCEVIGESPPFLRRTRFNLWARSGPRLGKAIQLRKSSDEPGIGTSARKGYQALSHGQSVQRTIQRCETSSDVISCRRLRISQREVDRYMRVCQAEGIKLPSKPRLEKKGQRLQQLTSQHFTDVSIPHNADLFILAGRRRCRSISTR